MRTTHRRPRQLLLLLLVVAAAVALAGFIGAHEATANIYSLAQVQDGLAHQPKAWLGRVVSLRAGILDLPVPVGRSPAGHDDSLMGYPLLALAGGTQTATWAMRPRSLPGGTLSHGSRLVLVSGGEAPVLRALRQAPLLAGLVPRPQTLDFLAAAAYRVRLQIAPTTSMACLTGPCYEAVLLDAAPWPSLRYTNFLN